MKVGLTGATGFVGSHLAEYLVRHHHQITCLVRETSNLQWISHLPFRKVVGNIHNLNSLSNFVRNQEVIIHAAGLTIARKEEEYIHSNAAGTESLLQAIQKANPQLKRFVLISSLAAAGPSRRGQALTEDQPLRPLTAYGRSKVKAEEIATQFFNRIPITIIRPPAVYGPRDKALLIYFKLVKKRIKPIIGNENKVSVVGVQNLAAGIIAATFHPNAVGQRYFIADDGDFTWSQLADLIAAALQKRPFTIKIPAWMVRLLANLSTVYSAVSKKPAILNREKILEMEQPFWLVSNRKAKKEIQYFPLLSTERAIKETADWYIKNGWL